METAELVEIVKASIKAEQASISKADHPHVAAAHFAAIRDLNDRLEQIRRSTRLSDKIVLQA